MSNNDKYVIDTHIFLWLMFNPEKINCNVLSVLENVDYSVSITSISFWEIGIKYNLGKLELNGINPDQLPSIAKQMDIDIVEVDSTTMASFYKLNKVAKHKDPFDRLIIWKCITDNYILLSADNKFMEYESFGLRRL